MERLLIENATILFRNFAGKEGEYNREGDRNFVVLIRHDLAETLASQGWNVKYLKPREEGDLPDPYLQVTVNMKGPRPAKVVLITSAGRSDVPEDELNILDWADFETVDLVINPYEWEIKTKTETKSGVKAYLQSMYAVLEENEIEKKYANIPRTSIPVISEED